MPGDNKPLQVLTEGERIRSIHGTQYARLWNLDLVQLVKEHATDFSPPPKGFNGGTGLYAGVGAARPFSETGEAALICPQLRSRPLA